MNRNYAIIVASGILGAAIDILLKVLLPVVQNYSLGLGLDLAINPAIVHAVLIVIAIILFRFLSQPALKYLLLFMIFVSLSNLYDRVRFGYVRDYLDFMGIWFNLADLAIVCAVIIYFVYHEYQTYHSRNSSR